MSNIESARAAIEAELSHAKNGLDYYHSRIGALEKMLAQLSGFQGTATPPTAASRGKRGRKPLVLKAAQVEKAPKVKAARKSGSSGLPFTGGDFWQNLVLDEPRSFPDILDAAISTLGIEPTKTQRQKLSGRMIFAINALVKTKKIRDSGSGRARRFFKA
jgi:hypothetical protein